MLYPEHRSSIAVLGIPLRICLVISEKLKREAGRDLNMASIPIRTEDINGIANGDAPVQHYDVIVIGAGFSGIANLYRLRKDGLKVHVFESGTYPSFLYLHMRRRNTALRLASYRLNISTSKSKFISFEITIDSH